MKLVKIPYYMETDGGLIRKEHYLKKIYKRFLVSGAKGYFSPSTSSDEYLIYYGAIKEKIYRYPFTSLSEKEVLKKPLKFSEKLFYKEKLKVSEKKMILAVGQFIPRKGFDVLLRASKSLDKEIGVYIVGGEPNEEYIRIKNKLDLKHIYFESFKSNEDLKDYFRAADLFVLPTREDIWGLVINEAMGFGLPIITTDRCVAGIELVENEKTGIIIPVDNEIELVSSINKIFSDEIEKDKMQINCIEKIQEYTIENMVKKHIEVLLY